MAVKYNLFCTFAKMLSFHLQTGRDLHLFILLESIVRVLWVIDLYSCHSLMSVIVWFLDFHCLHWYGIVRISHYCTIKMRTFPMLFSWWYINLENQTAITSEFLIVRKIVWRNQLFYPCYNDNNIWRLYLFFMTCFGGRFWFKGNCRREMASKDLPSLEKWDHVIIFSLMWTFSHSGSQIEGSISFSYQTIPRGWVSSWSQAALNA